MLSRFSQKLDVMIVTKNPAVLASETDLHGCLIVATITASGEDVGGRYDGICTVSKSGALSCLSGWDSGLYSEPRPWPHCLLVTGIFLMDRALRVGGFCIPCSRLQNRGNELWGPLFLPYWALNFGASSEGRSDYNLLQSSETVSFESRHRSERIRFWSKISLEKFPDCG